MAPNEDQEQFGKLTDHEVAAIEFAKTELANDPESAAPLHNYLEAIVLP